MRFVLILGVVLAGEILALNNLTGHTRSLSGQIAQVKHHVLTDFCPPSASNPICHIMVLLLDDT
jgi:hypothetical protein